MFGGQRPGDLAGHYFEPTLVECASPDTDTLKVEMFGPVRVSSRIRSGIC